MLSSKMTVVIFHSEAVEIQHDAYIQINIIFNGFFNTFWWHIEGVPKIWYFQCSELIFKSFFKIKDNLVKLIFSLEYQIRRVLFICHNSDSIHTEKTLIYQKWAQYFKSPNQKASKYTLRKFDVNIYWISSVSPLNFTPFTMLVFSLPFCMKFNYRTTNNKSTWPWWLYDLG